MYYSTYMYIIGVITSLTTLIGTTAKAATIITLSNHGTFLGLQPVEHAVVFLATIPFLYFALLVESYEESGFPL